MQVDTEHNRLHSFFSWVWRALSPCLPIKHLLIMIIMTVSVVGLLTAFSLATFFQLQEIHDNTIQQVETLAKVLSDNSQAAVLFGHGLDGQQVLSSLRNEPSVIRAFLYTQQGDVLASYLAAETVQRDAPPFNGYAIANTDDSVSLFYPIQADGEEVGGLYLQATFDRVAQQLKKNGIITFWVVVVTLVGCFLISSKLHAVISGPILQLAHVSTMVSEQQDLSVRSHAYHFQEIAILSHRFNEMLERLQHQDHVLRAHGEELENRVAARTAELQQSVQQLDIARVTAEVANKSKDEFLSQMSHELRTPLHAILGFSNLLRRMEKSSKTETEYLQIICDSGQHLLGLINDVLDMAAISSGKICLDLSDFNLPLMLERVCSMLTLKAEQKGLRLYYEGHGVPEYIFGDERKIREILINLVSNAIKFTHQGSVTLRVNTSDHSGIAEKEKRNLCIDVIDTGPGIDPDEQMELFLPFSRLTTRRNNDEVGSGLGLSICQGFVQEMEGTIRVESIVDMGTTFHVVLPIMAVTSPRLAAPDKEIVGIKPGQREFRILVVEDHDYSRKMIVQLLKTVGFTVHEATNGYEAVEQWCLWRPDLTLLDIQMPRVDGFEAAKRIRERNSTAVIIYLTASVHLSSNYEEDMAFCNDLLTKPFKEYDLFTIMAEHFPIEYLYDEESLFNVAHPDVELTMLTADDLAGLPSSTIEALHYGAQRGSPEDILHVVDTLSSDFVQVGNCLQHLANQFLFSKIVTATRMCLDRIKSDAKFIL